MSDKYCPHVGNQPYIHGFCPWCDNDLLTGILTPIFTENSDKKNGEDIARVMDIRVPMQFAVSPHLKRAYCLGKLSKNKPEIVKERSDLSDACEQYAFSWKLLRND